MSTVVWTPAVIVQAPVAYLRLWQRLAGYSLVDMRVNVNSGRRTTAELTVIATLSVVLLLCKEI